jgi:hypothetical protein
MSVDIRGRRVTSDDLLLPEQQVGLVPSNDEEDMDEDEDDVDAWIPNGRILRERALAREQRTSGGAGESDSETELDIALGTNASKSALPDDVAHLINTEEDRMRKALLQAGCNQRHRLIASDIADLTSTKLQDLLSSDNSHQGKRKEGDSDLEGSSVRRGNAAMRLKGSGSSVALLDVDFSVDVNDL